MAVLLQGVLSCFPVNDGSWSLPELVCSSIQQYRNGEQWHRRSMGPAEPHPAWPGDSSQGVGFMSQTPHCAATGVGNIMALSSSVCTEATGRTSLRRNCLWIGLFPYDLLRSQGFVFGLLTLSATKQLGIWKAGVWKQKIIEGVDFEVIMVPATICNRSVTSSGLASNEKEGGPDRHRSIPPTQKPSCAVGPPSFNRVQFTWPLHLSASFVQVLSH